MLYAYARNTDPDTSWITGEHIENTDAATAQRERVLSAIKSLIDPYHGYTSMELSAMSGIDSYTIAIRLPEITDVTQGQKRVCKISGRQCVVWMLRKDKFQ